MVNLAQTKAVRNYRKRLTEKGFARFEVLGDPQDKALVRAVAKRLALAGPDSARLRAELSDRLLFEPTGRGSIWDALRRSPLVGADLDLTREFVEPREVNL